MELYAAEYIREAADRARDAWSRTDFRAALSAARVAVMRAAEMMDDVEAAATAHAMQLDERAFRLNQAGAPLKERLKAAEAARDAWQFVVDARGAVYNERRTLGDPRRLEYLADRKARAEEAARPWHKYAASLRDSMFCGGDNRQFVALLRANSWLSREAESWSEYAPRPDGAARALLCVAELLRLNAATDVLHMVIVEQHRGGEAMDRVCLLTTEIQADGKVDRIINKIKATVGYLDAVFLIRKPDNQRVLRFEWELRDLNAAYRAFLLLWQMRKRCRLKSVMTNPDIKNVWIDET
jgi:hypothetical protein